MPITYPEGGMPGLLLKQKKEDVPGIDTVRVQLIHLRPAPKAMISGPEDVVALVKQMENFDRESAVIIHLDTKNQVMGIETISIGSLNASIVHPRETVKGAILNNSASTIFVHNHPSGICSPSREDIAISGKLKEAFEMVGIVLLDSIIVGKGCYYSLKETGFISGEMKTVIKRVEEPIVSERISDLPKTERMKLAREIIATTGPAHDHSKYIPLNNLSKISKEERMRAARGITATMVMEGPGLKAKLDHISVCTGKPINESQVIGAVTPMNGHLVGYHLSDNPDEVVRRLQSDNLVVMNPIGDLGGGLYISSVPEYWRVRSSRKWDFAKKLTKAQRQNLVNVILADPRYRKGGGYLTDFELIRLYRDLNSYVDMGDVSYLTLTGNQPYNIRITADITTKAGLPAPKEPGLVEVTLSGKFIDASGLYTNPLRDEVINTARLWAIKNMPGLDRDVKNTVSAWLDSMGYSGMFTRSGMTSNPEMVVWNRKAIVSVRKVV